MRGTTRWGVAVAAAVALCAGPGTVAAKGPKGTKPPAEPELSKRIDEAVQKAGGADLWGTVLVAKGGEIVFLKGYGFADYEKKPNTGDTLFEIASTSKQFAAAAILRLEDQKKLKTSDTLDKLSSRSLDATGEAVAQLVRDLSR